LILLNELLSNLQLLLFGTSSLTFTNLEEECASIFSSLNVWVPWTNVFLCFLGYVG
jgi:ATPase family AAA domain-containing protein 2